MTPLLLFVIPFLTRAEPDAVVPGSEASHHLPIENHHSLFPPMDTSLHYWTFGGATVAAQSFLRLTPSAQSRTGWLWNQYTLRSNDWEMQIEFSVRSDFHIGGDGFAIWVLEKQLKEDNLKDGNNWMAGPVSGMRSDFKGFGVIFDTYDNDQNRKNPSIMVVKNDGSKTDWDHDRDFEPNRVTDVYSDGKHTEELQSSCTLEYRNKKEVTALLRYQNGVLHIYTDLDGGDGDEHQYKTCLAVKIDVKCIDTHHLAFTAHTGAVADIHDINGIVVRYLDKDDPELDDWLVARQGSIRKSGWRLLVFWITSAIVAGYLLFLTFQEYSAYTKNIGGNTSLLCAKVNDSRSKSSKVSAGLTIFFVFTGAYWAVLFNLPKFLIHTWEFMTNFKLDPQVLAKMNKKAKGATPLQYLYLELGSAGLSALYCTYKIFR